MTLHNGHMDNGEHVLPIILHLRPLVSMYNILDRILIEVESLLQVSQLLACRALRINPQHLTRTDLIRKHGHGLRRSPAIRLEKSESDQCTASANELQIKRS